MGFNLGILISGNGSNMKNIIDACKNGSLKSSVSIVISDNPLAKGLSLAKKENVESVLIDRDKFSSAENNWSKSQNGHQPTPDLNRCVALFEQCHP